MDQRQLQELFGGFINRMVPNSAGRALGLQYTSARRVPPPSQLKITTKAWRAIFADKAPSVSLEDGDKVILHSDVLETMMQSFGHRPLPHPMIFEIQNPVTKKVSHCGVLEFSAPSDAAYLPTWMMDNLQLEDGAGVVLKPKALPKATYVKLQPKKYEFTKIPDPKKTLEYLLRKFTAVTEGDVLCVQYGSQSYLLNVNAVRPSPAACLIDTEVQVEFDPPEEPAPAEEKVEQITLGQSINGVVNSDGFHYYRLKLDNPQQSLKLELQSHSGDADLYVSTNTQYPSLADHQWSSFHAQSDVLMIDPTDPKFSQTWYYLGVHGYKSQASYTLTATQVDHRSRFGEAPASGAAAGAPLSATAPFGAGVAVGRIDSTTDPNAKQCQNCLQFIGPGQYSLHTLQCARHNWLCPTCKQVVKKSEQAAHSHCNICNAVVHPADLQKHIEFTHTKIKCECGAEVEPASMSEHKQNSCPRRLTKCIWCEMQLPMSEKVAHEDFCGSRSVPCEICRQEQPRKRMTIHKAVVHGINPCVNEKGDNRAMTPRTAAAAAAEADILPTDPEAADLDLQRALAMSVGGAPPSTEARRSGRGQPSKSLEDEMLERALAASEEEAKITPRTAAAQPPPPSRPSVAASRSPAVKPAAAPPASAMDEHISEEDRLLQQALEESMKGVSLSDPAERRDDDLVFTSSNSFAPLSGSSLPASVDLSSLRGRAPAASSTVQPLGQRSGGYSLAPPPEEEPVPDDSAFDTEDFGDFDNDNGGGGDADGGWEDDIPADVIAESIQGSQSDSCPLCGKTLPVSQLQRHAERCDGSGR